MTEETGRKKRSDRENDKRGDRGSDRRSEQSRQNPQDKRTSESPTAMEEDGTEATNNEQQIIESSYREASDYSDIVTHTQIIIVHGNSDRVARRTIITVPRK